MTDPTVLVVGAGPAACGGTVLAAAGVGPVVVADREADPVACRATATTRASASRTSPVAVRPGLRPAARGRADRRRGRPPAVDHGGPPADDGTVTLVGPVGPATVAPRVRGAGHRGPERPRPARLVPGDRPAGVFTTGQLQQWVAAGLPVGRRAVVVGAEHVAYSAALTLRHARVTTVAMVTELPRHQTVGGFALAARHGLRVPLRTSTRVVDLVGHGRLTPSWSRTW